MLCLNALLHAYPHAAPVTGLKVGQVAGRPANVLQNKSNPIHPIHAMCMLQMRNIICLIATLVLVFQICLHAILTCEEYTLARACAWCLLLLIDCLGLSLLPSKAPIGWLHLDMPFTSKAVPCAANCRVRKFYDQSNHAYAMPCLWIQQYASVCYCRSRADGIRLFADSPACIAVDAT